MPSNMEMELIALKANSLLKMKFGELSSLPSASEMIGFWRSLSWEHLPKMRAFAQSNACLFGATYRCEQSFSFMKIITNKLRSRRSDSSLKNWLLLSVTNLTPNITGLVKAKRKQKSHWSHIFILSVYKIVSLKTANCVRILLSELFEVKLSMKFKKCCVRSFPLQLLHLSSSLNKLGNACLYLCCIR